MKAVFKKWLCKLGNEGLKPARYGENKWSEYKISTLILIKAMWKLNDKAHKIIGNNGYYILPDLGEYNVFNSGKFEVAYSFTIGRQTALTKALQYVFSKIGYK